MANGSTHYASANAFRRALEDRLKSEAKARGQALGELRREFLFQRFLALIFCGPDSQWVLKGGASLLMRLAEARFSKDLDLLHLGELSAEEAIAVSDTGGSSNTAASSRPSSLSPDRS